MHRDVEKSEFFSENDEELMVSGVDGHENASFGFSKVKKKTNFVRKVERE